MSQEAIGEGIVMLHILFYFCHRVVCAIAYTLAGAAPVAVRIPCGSIEKNHALCHSAALTNFMHRAIRIADGHRARPCLSFVGHRIVHPSPRSRPCLSFVGHRIVHPSPRSRPCLSFVGHRIVHPSPRSRPCLSFVGHRIVHPSPRSRPCLSFVGHRIVHPSPRSRLRRSNL